MHQIPDSPGVCSRVCSGICSGVCSGICSGFSTTCVASTHDVTVLAWARGMTFYERILRWHREWNEDEEAIQRLDARASAAIGGTARDGTTASCRDYVPKKGKVQRHPRVHTGKPTWFAMSRNRPGRIHVGHATPPSDTI